MLSLRPYQLDGIARAREALRTHRSVLIVGPTGMGKTVLAAHMIESARAKGRRSLMVAHRKELIRQPFCKIVRAGCDPRQIGIVLAGIRGDNSHLFGDEISEHDAELWAKWGRRRPDAPIQIAGIDTLRNRKVWPEADFIVVDEAHRSLAKSYEKLWSAYPNAKIVGLTATPQRGDGRGLRAAFGAMVVVAKYSELVADGFLVEPTAWTVPRTPDVSRVRVVGSDYDPEELARVCDTEALVGDVVDHYRRRGNGAPAFAFGVTVAHSAHIAQSFRDAGIAAAHVSGSTDPIERDRLVRDLGTGALKVLANCDVMTEGVDVPAVKTIILCCPTRSLRRFMQQCGRGSRPHANGLPFVILDHAGAINDHGMPNADQEWSLDGRRKKEKTSSPPTKSCPKCYGIVGAACRVCPDPCGHVFPLDAPAEREPDQIDGELVEVRALTPAEERAAWDQIVARWHKENKKRASPLRPGWCWFEYRRRFGKAPPAGCTPPSLTSEQQARRVEFEQLQRQARERGYAHGFAHARMAERPRAAEWEEFV